MTVVTTETETTAISSPLLERKIQETAAAMKVEINLSDHYRKDLIGLLTQFSKFNNDRNFKDITHSDIIAFLDTHRKTETADPLHKWIGT
jgi:hypothetical protein